MISILALCLLTELKISWRPKEAKKNIKSLKKEEFKSKLNLIQKRDKKLFSSYKITMNRQFWILLAYLLKNTKKLKVSLLALIKKNWI